MTAEIIPRRMQQKQQQGGLCRGSAQGARVLGVEKWLLLQSGATVWAKQSPRQFPVHISTWPA